jgi:hypothetical protein
VVVAGYALAGLFLSPLVLAPFGLPGPEPTLQMHVRGVPFRWLPFELTLRNVPGYHRVPLGDVRLIGRRDVVLPRGETIWLHGATPVEIQLIAGEELGPLAFQVASASPANRIELSLGDWSETFELGEGEARRVELPRQEPTRRWTIKDGTLYAYRLVARTSAGRVRVWERELPPPSCPGWPWQPKEPDAFSSRAAWPAGGGARVRLAYHWLRAGPPGEEPLALYEGERSELPRTLAPGEEAVVEMRVMAPAEAGRYLLALDPVFEGVAWFSDRNPDLSPTLPVEVLPAPPAPGAESR